MRIVIVEDETKTRNGILKMIQQFTDSEVVGIAENGLDGYALVKQTQPDLIISDIRMPVMDGLEMLQKLAGENVSFQAILLTGYSDFEYARKALQLQVVDYLLKPLDLEVFLKTMNEVETRISSTKLRQISMEQMIAGYMEETGEEKENRKLLLHEMLHVNENTELSLFLLAPRRMFSGRVSEMISCLREQLEALCIENSHALAVPGEKKILVLVAGTERNRSLKRRFELKILPELNDIGQCTCVYGKLNGIDGLAQAVKTLEACLPFAFSLPEEEIIDAQSVCEVHYETLSYPLHLENSVIRELRNGNRKKAEDYGRRFIDEVVDSGADPELIRQYAIRMIASVSRVAETIQEHPEQAETVQYDVEMIVLSEVKSQVRYQLEKFFHTVTGAGAQEAVLTENGIVMNAVSYIRTHYKEDITLTEIARVCRVSPEYLSKIFYKETGINFSPFLQNFRISEAKRLLRKENCRVYEVAEAVGFHDQKYFVKVFKKLCGMTPTEYRKETKL